MNKDFENKIQYTYMTLTNQHRTSQLHVIHTYLGYPWLNGQFLVFIKQMLPWTLVTNLSDNSNSHFTH